MPIITKEDELEGRARVDAALSKMHEGERAVHAKARLDGQVDEACFSCPKVLLAHNEVVECGHKECPFKKSEMYRQRLFPRTHEQHLAQTSLPLRG